MPNKKKEVATKKPAKKRSTSKKSVTKKSAAKSEVKDFLDDIKKRAHEIYLERQKNGIGGDEMSDWLQAEEEIKNKYKRKKG